MIDTIKKLLQQKIAKFGYIGLFNTALSIVLHYIFLEIAGLNIYVSYALVFLISVSLAAYLNSVYTFKQKFTLKILFKFYLIYLVSLLFGYILLFIYNKFLPDLSDFYKTILTIPPRVLFSYFFVKGYAFEKT